MKTKKSLLFGLALLIICSPVFVKAQGGLQYNQTKIVGNSSETVPAGKVWKMSSVYGTDRVCVLGIAEYSGNSYYSTNNYRVAYVGGGFSVNGNVIFSERKWDLSTTTAINIYSDAGCTAKYTTDSKGWGAYDVLPNPNILPMWIPAGSVVQTVSPNVFLSVMEFNEL